ncbi:uncharacterized protein H6S33_010163 [Morchella sextelata]|uniref:uncharacterized protein n=1 Tax=Morchella sextelata TaxID=1174677 RepID=UPI001D04BCD7|nr:uncharacterized protein H6S33_010163 [Morchella sextelata]KAH0612111.1 hypothetical protein H6S33_010163 [Morchella sextelata]
MGKSLRASRIKSNKSKLAAAVFRPVEDARTARLSAKLLALANSGKEPIRGPGEMEVEVETKESEKPEEPAQKEGAMEVDGEKFTEPSKKKINASRIRRRGRQSRHAVVFPGVQKGGKGGIRSGVGRRSKRT